MTIAPVDLFRMTPWLYESGDAKKISNGYLTDMIDISKNSNNDNLLPM
jgi:hypothetical protein